MIRLLIILLLILTASAVPAQNQDDMPTQFDMAMLANADYQLSIINTDAAGTAINLTGYRYAAQFRNAPAPAGAVFATYSTTIVNASAGKLKVSLSKAQTLPLSGKSGLWDLMQIGPTGLVTYLLRGKASVVPTTTRLP